MDFTAPFPESAIMLVMQSSECESESKTERFHDLISLSDEPV